MCTILVENKSIHRNREKKKEAEHNKRRMERWEEATNSGFCGYFKYFLVDIVGLTTFHKTKYLGMPIIKIIPSVLFRFASLWMIFSYSAEYYANTAGDGSGRGMLIPFLLNMVIVLINFGVSFGILECRKEESLVNSICNVVLPVYEDLFTVVSKR